VLPRGRDEQRWPDFAKEGGGRRSGLRGWSSSGASPVTGWVPWTRFLITNLLAMTSLPGDLMLQSGEKKLVSRWPWRLRLQIDQREEEGWGFDGDDLKTCTGTTKRKGNGDTNAMMCSPSTKDERRRRKSSPELRRSRRSRGSQRSRRRIRMTSSSPEVRWNLVDAKVR
jgi:hypothetical protein